MLLAIAQLAAEQTGVAQRLLATRADADETTAARHVHKRPQCECGEQGSDTPVGDDEQPEDADEEYRASDESYMNDDLIFVSALKLNLDLALLLDVRKVIRFFSEAIEQRTNADSADILMCAWLATIDCDL